MQPGRRRPQRAAAQRNSKVDFSKCDATLQGYIKQNKMDTNVGASREETIEAVGKHFMSTAPPTEEDAIAAFLLALKKKYSQESVGTKRPRPGGNRQARPS